MKIKLIQGQFNSNEAMDILSKMIDVKIKFHEKKIENSHHEEDIKMRETRIKNLQKELHDVRKYVESNGNKITMESEINFIN
jgi:hypothetical protein